MKKPFIKKHRNNNNYLLTKSGYWIRDYTIGAQPVDINKLLKPDEYNIVLKNEYKNRVLSTMSVKDESITIDKCLIVSDGYGFKENLKLLEKLPEDVNIIAVNRVLPNWNINRKVDLYLVNNPYVECMSYLPPKGSLYPSCVASSRTYNEFLKRYSRRGTVYMYKPTSNDNFTGITMMNCQFLDDYRTPVCAAINLAYKFGATKLGLFCCDEAFEDERPGIKQLPSGLWSYPQNQLAHEFIDGTLYWFHKREYEEPEVVCYPEVEEYENASYISKEGLLEFFNK